MIKYILVIALLPIKVFAESSSYKSYEYYFPSLKSPEKEVLIIDDLEDINNLNTKTIDNKYNNKKKCKVKEAPGPKKIGNPYIIQGIKYYPMSSAAGYEEDGIASWYGPGFHGKLTANGEIYNQKAMTAAHRTLPLPTFVRVKNLENSKEIIVRINDRGPYSKGRIIDLTEEGARRLGMLQKGTAKVRVTVLSEDEDCYISGGEEIDLDKGSFAIQVGAFTNKDNAKKIALKHGSKAVIKIGYQDNKLFNRVWIIGYTSKHEADEALIVYSREYFGAFIIAQ